VVDEDVVQPIETPRLDGQRRGTHALFDERHRLTTQRVQKWPAATEYTGDG
jgi:hypothetical protein